MPHILSVIHVVEEVGAAALFCQEVLGWALIAQDAGSATLDNQSVRLRLQAATDEQVSGALRVEISVRDLEAHRERWAEHPAFSVLREVHHVDVFRAEVHLQGPHGFVLVLSRTYDEDELGLIPPLETELCWEEKAEELLRRLLLLVPVAFRQNARTRCVEIAEWLAVEGGDVEVDTACAVRASIRGAPFFMRDVVREQLVEEGIDVARYAEEFGQKEEA